MKYDVIVVGAGAAGLIASGRAAELGAKVLLVEKMERAGRKLLITGKGRCNITNDASMADFISHINPDGRFLRPAFSTFFSKDIVSLLEKYGVETIVERGGRVFPVSNVAADVVNALLKWVNEKGVEIIYNCKTEKLLISDNVIIGFAAIVKGELKEYYAGKIILCTGGCSYPATGSNGEGYNFAKSVGHSIEPAMPALVPLETLGDMASNLQGLSLKNINASVWVNGKKIKDEFGEMLFTHFGLSGPVILTLSRYVVNELRKNNEVEISIDLKPALDGPKLDARLQRDLNENGKKRFDNILKLWLPTKMIPVFIGLLGIDPAKECHQVTSKERKKILLLLKDLRFKISGHRSFKEAIITAGGINTKEIDPKTMGSRIIKNLFFAGEIIDADADTGGYNLQIAWSTGWLAAEACIK
jgi:predicted Rossmann fold flavoprotein